MTILQLIKTKDNNLSSTTKNPDQYNLADLEKKNQLDNFFHQQSNSKDINKSKQSSATVTKIQSVKINKNKLQRQEYITKQITLQPPRKIHLNKSTLEVFKSKEKFKAKKWTAVIAPSAPLIFALKKLERRASNKILVIQPHKKFSNLELALKTMISPTIEGIIFNETDSKSVNLLRRQSLLTGTKLLNTAKEIF